MKRSLLAAIVAFASAGLVSTADASFEIPLEGDFYSQGAQGLVGIQESELASYEKQLMIEVNGLRPNSVYSVWLTRKDPSRVQGLGVEDYSFTTDASGGGRFVAYLPVGELSNWDTLEVAHHPNGDPKDLDNAQIALRGDLDTYD